MSVSQSFLLSTCQFVFPVLVHLLVRPINGQSICLSVNNVSNCMPDWFFMSNRLYFCLCALFVLVFVCLSVCLSVSQSVSLSIWLSVCLFVRITSFLSYGIPFWLSYRMSCLSSFLSICPSDCMNDSVCLLHGLPFQLKCHTSVCFSHCLTVYICKLFCLSYC